MPHPPPELPPQIRGVEFSTRRAWQVGVTRSRVRAADIVAPFYGTRAPAGVLSLAERCRARATRLPLAAVFSHVTAAGLWDLPLPSEADLHPHVHVTVPTGRRAPQGKTTRGHQAALAAADVVERAGIRLTSPVRTWRDLGGALGLTELVAIADVLIRRGWADAAGLSASVDAHPPRRGGTALRRAIALADGGAESPKESELRVLLTLAGVTGLVTQHVVRDARGGFVARVDLADLERRIVIEYDGDHHRSRAQWRADVARRRRIEALGWIYVPVTQRDLTDPASLLTDLVVARARHSLA